MSPKVIAREADPCALGRPHELVEHEREHEGHEHEGHEHEGHHRHEHAHGTASATKKGHSHAHGHAHGGLSQGSTFALAVALNFLFSGIEVAFGLISGSMSLVADAAHNLGDAAGLFFAWGATLLARSKPSSRRTWGLRRSTILAALANALLIFASVGAVVWEAIHRLSAPSPVQGGTMMIVAAIGVVINTGTALLFHRDKDHDVNVRGAFLHLAGDAAVSLGVVVAGYLVLRTGRAWIDPVVSLVVAGVIFVSTWSLLREALDLALDAVPDHIDPDAVRGYLENLTKVREVHAFHVWPTSTTETALTAHLVIDCPETPPGLVAEATRELRQRYHIDHVTLQIEPTERSGA